MQISELRKVFSNLEHLLEVSQASKGLVTDLARLSACLAAFDEWTVTQFCKQCEHIGNGNQQHRLRASQIDESLVADAVARLMAVREERGGIEAALSDIQADKRIRIGEINAIAKQIVGGTNQYRKKGDAYRDIKLRLEAHIAAKHRTEASSDIF